jgi:hypothetical protein
MSILLIGLCFADILQQFAIDGIFSHFCNFPVDNFIPFLHRSATNEQGLLSSIARYVLLLTDQ